MKVTKRRTEIIAVFDFDGTITNCDTFIDFLHYSFSFSKLLCCYMRFAIDLIGYCLRIKPENILSEKIFHYFLRGVTLSDYHALVQCYATERIEKILNSKIMEKIIKHKEQGHSLVVLSASPEDWIIPWATKNGFFNVIATQIQVKDRICTGKFSSAYCFGEEKIRRFKKVFYERKQYTIYAYGNSKDDLPFLKYADFGYLFNGREFTLIK